jgi:hypothetical protein
MRAPRAFACSSSSRTTTPAPPAMTKPSRFVGAACGLGPVVEIGGHGVHGVEQDRERPVELLAAAGEDDVLLAQLDQFGAVADAVGRCRAGRGDRVAHALDVIGRGERGRVRRAHGFRHFERPDLLRALFARRVGGADDGAGRGAARTHDEARALVRDVVLFKARVADRLLHGEVVPGGARAHEATHLAVDHAFPVELGRAMDLAAEAELGIGVGLDDARFRFAQRGEHLLGAIADGGHDAHPRHDDTFHRVKILRRPAPLRANTIRHRRARARLPGTGRREGPSRYR